MAAFLEACTVRVTITVVCPAKAVTFNGSLANLLPTGGLGMNRISNKPSRYDTAHCRADTVQLLAKAVAKTRNHELRLTGGHSGNRDQCRPGFDATDRRRATASQGAGYTLPRFSRPTRPAACARSRCRPRESGRISGRVEKAAQKLTGGFLAVAAICLWMAFFVYSGVYKAV